MNSIKPNTRVPSDGKIDAAIYLGATLGLVVLAYLILTDVTRHDAAPGSGPVIATVASSENSVRSRPAALPSWEEIVPGHSLHEKDQVYTSTSAMAEIELTGGTQVTVQENTLVILEMEARSAALNIRRGIVYVVSGKGGDDVLFKVNGVRGRVKAGNSEAVINVAEDGVADVIVLKGQATLEDSAPISERQVSRVSPDGRVSAAIVMPLILTAPAWNAGIFLERGTSVDFAWSAEPEIGDQRLEIARDATFASVVRQIKVEGQTASLATDVLPAGRFYWRVVGMRSGGDGSPVTSDVRQVNFLSLTGPIVTRPTTGETFSYLAGDQAGQLRHQPKVVIDWQMPSAATAAEIEWTRLDGMAAPRLVTVARPPYIDDDLADGQYTVRVRARFPDNVTTAWSQPIPFDVAPMPGPKAPLAVEPADGADYRLGRPSPVTFRIAGRDVRTFHVEVSRSPAFDDDPVTMNGVGIKAKWVPDKPGVYYWRSRTVDVFGRQSPFSEPRRVEIKAAKRQLAPPTLERKDVLLEWGEQEGFVLPGWLMPVAFAADPASAHATLAWPTVDGARAYRIQIATERSFADVLVDERLEKASYRWQNAVPGAYFYRVAVFDGDDEASAFSEPAPLTVNVPAPVLVKPAPDARLEATGSAEFIWKGAPTVPLFRVELARDREFKSIIGRKSSPHGRLTLEVDDGVRFWRVVAVNEDGSVASTSEPRSLTVKARPAPPAKVAAPAPPPAPAPAPPTKPEKVAKVAAPNQITASPGPVAPPVKEPPPDGLSYVAAGYAVAAIDYQYSSADTFREMRGTADHAAFVEAQWWSSRWLGVAVRARGHAVQVENEASTSWTTAIDAGPRFGLFGIAGLYANPYIGYVSPEVLYFERSLTGDQTVAERVRLHAATGGVRLIWGKGRTAARLGAEYSHAFGNDAVDLGQATQGTATALVQYRITGRTSIGLVYAYEYRSFGDVKSTTRRDAGTGSVEDRVQYAGGLVGWLL